MKKLNLIQLLVAGASLVTLTGAMAASSSTASTATGSTFSQQQQAEIDQRVHDYLINNPEILIEVSQKLKDKEQAQTQKVVTKAITDNKEEVFSDSSTPSYFAGKGTPAVTIVEFFDYQCIHCRNMAGRLDDLLQHNKDIKIIFREFPIFGADSEYAAKAALASVKQGKYYAFHRALFNADAALTKEEVDKIAKSVGLNTDQLHKDIEQQAANLQKQLDENRKLGQRLYIEGTPLFVIGGKVASVAGHRSGLPTQFVFIPQEVPKDQLENIVKQIQ